MKHSFRWFWLILLAPVLFSHVLALSGNDIHAIQLTEDSDWWSEKNPNFESPPDEWSNEWSKRVIPATNFKILGTSLLGKPPHNWLESKFGKAQAIVRGDAGDFRDQRCYTSVKPGNVYLISEAGEVDLGFYLFADGRAWRGQEFCRPNPLVDRHLATDSGLRLGSTKAQVKTVLGAPLYEKGNLLYYLFEIKIPTTPEAVGTFLHQNPSYLKSDIFGGFPAEVSDYTLSASFRLEFKNNRLVYLSISKSEIN
ncbi:MAG: hypothetical protein ABSD63_09850 [Candidatus Korobacteraceae bacterium]|jgi:hypothetical protein